MIRIKNIYYMLSYAFQVLKEQGYKNIATEHFENTAELFAAILIKGVSIQLKRGLGKEYVLKNEPLSNPKGKINISESIKGQTIRKKQLFCEYDDFSVNSYMNRIIKTSFDILLRSEISGSRKKEIRKLMIFFNEVDILDIHTINWNIQYNKNNHSYLMLISICHLLIKGLIQTTSGGISKLMDFLDEQRMCKLYEKFILEYYRKEFPGISVSSSQIRWFLDDDSDDMLPKMQSDIMLSYKNKVLIIDAKYYKNTTQIMSQYNSHTIHSANLYQIFTYVKNKDSEFGDTPHEVSGMLLYAKTDETIQPDSSYRMSGNRIDVKTLNLNCDFDEIKEQLNSTVNEFFAA